MMSQRTTLQVLVIACSFVWLFAGIHLADAQETGANSEVGSCASKVLRPFPYPFGNMLSYASDVDQQTPENGGQFHQYANEKYGLPLSDSIWVQTRGEKLSGLFDIRTRRPHNRSIGKTNLPTYFYLLREWHRGNADHFHSWQTGDNPVFAIKLDAGLKVGTKKSTHPLEFKSDVTFFKTPHFLKLFSDDELPPNTIITLRDEDGINLDIPLAEAHYAGELGEEYEKNGDEFSYAYEFDLWSKDEFGSPIKPVVDLDYLTEFQIQAKGCHENCNSSVMKIEISAFSRQSVKLQSPWLLKHGVTPNFISSHGGFDISQDYANDPVLTKLSNPAHTKLGYIKSYQIPEGNTYGSPNFHADILKNIGVESIWPYTGANLVAPTVNIPAPESMERMDQYRMLRTFYYNGLGKETPESLIAAIESELGADGLLPEEKRKIENAFCGPGCEAQGDSVALQILTSLAQMSRRKGAEHFWYTHFSSGGDKAYKRAGLEDFHKPQTVEALGDLAAAYYGWNTSFPSSHRPWVLSAGSWARYWMVKDMLSRNVVADEANSVIQISSWNDEVIGRRVPSGKYPETDLHGMSFYVDDSATAKILLDGEEITSVVRNSADECGRMSITIVDPHTPTRLSSESDLSAFASNRNGQFSFEIDPKNMVLHNVDHLSIGLNSGIEPVFSEFVLDIVTEGGSVRISDCGGASCSDYSGYVIPIDFSNIQNESIIVPLYSGQHVGDIGSCSETNNWSDCDVLTGEVRKIILSGKTRNLASKLGIRDIAFFRPNPLKIAQGQNVIVGGSVLNDLALYGSQVVLSNKSTGKQKSFEILGDMMYLFPVENINDSFEIILNTTDGRTCRPDRQGSFDFERSNLDLDIDTLEDCTAATVRAPITELNRAVFLNWLKL